MNEQMDERRSESINKRMNELVNPLGHQSPYVLTETRNITIKVT